MQTDSLPSEPPGKPFDCVDYNKLRKIPKEMEFQATLPVPPPQETYKQDSKQQLEPDMNQLTGSILGKEYDKSVHCHPVYI